jgi:elongation factor P
MTGRPAPAITRALFVSSNLKTRAGRTRPHSMAKIAGNEIAPGTLIEYDGGLWVAVKTQTVRSGRGGAYNQVELKHIVNGTKLNQRFRADEAVEEIYLDKKDFSFLYANGDMLTFMDVETYDQIELGADWIGDQSQFLVDGMKVMLQLHEGKPISIKLPAQVTLTVTQADPVLKGGTAAPSYKGAKLENGMTIQVPPFIDAGTKVVVSTADGSYVRRAE